MHSIAGARVLLYNAVKRNFYECEKFMRICQNGSLDKFMRFLLMLRSNVLHDKNLCDTNLRDLRLTCIIRINKPHAEICRFRVIRHCLGGFYVI